VAQVWQHVTSARILLAVIVLSSAFLLINGVYFREGYSGDEGYHITVASNMARSVGWIRPDPVPGGKDKDWQEAFFEGFPPLHYMLLALALICSGDRLAGLEFIPLLAFLATLLSIRKLVAFWDASAAFFAVLLLAVSPSMISLFGRLECEPVLTAFGSSGLCFFAAGELRRSWLYYLVSGFLLGLSFLTKLWLAVPFMFAAAAIFGLRRITLCRFELSDIYFAVITGVSFLLAASLHIIAVAIASPQDLWLWISRVYLGAFGGTAFNKFVTEGVPANWIHPFWYYPGILYRDHFFLLPLALLGLPFLVKRANRTMVIPLGMVIAGLSSIVLFSFPAVKEPLYILGGTCFCYIFTGFSLSSVVGVEVVEGALLRKTILVVLVLCVVLAVGVLAAFTMNMKPDDLTAHYAIVHTSVLLAICVFCVLLMRHPTAYAARAFTAIFLVALGLSALFNIYGKSPRDRVIANVIRPYVECRRPQDISFISPNFKSLQAYLYRQGRYWTRAGIVPPEPVVGELRKYNAFVLGPDELGNPDMRPLLLCLEENFQEKTNEVTAILGHEIPFRVFVNESALRGGETGDAAGSTFRVTTAQLVGRTLGTSSENECWRVENEPGNTSSAEQGRPAAPEGLRCSPSIQ